MGERGIAAYRAEVQRRLEIDRSAFAPGHALQQLALVDRDKEAVVRLFGGDLAGVHRYVAVAEALLAIGCRADALEWTRRGMALPASWQSRKLYDLAADVLADDGELAQVVDLRREGLEALPDSTSYAALRGAARATGQWDGLRDRALALLAHRSPDAHLQALLSDDDVDAAWAALAKERVLASTARQVAARRGMTHPQDAVPYARDAVEEVLSSADRRAYRQAVRQLLELRGLHERAGAPEQFRTYLDALVEANRRRPSFLDELRKGGLAEASPPGGC